LVDLVLVVPRSIHLAMTFDDHALLSAFYGVSQRITA
jgi:hypothetical protein